MKFRKIAVSIFLGLILVSSYIHPAAAFNNLQSELESQSIYASESRRYYHVNPDKVPTRILTSKVYNGRVYKGYISRVSMQYHAMEDYYVAKFAGYIPLDTTVTPESQ